MKIIRTFKKETAIALAVFTMVFSIVTINAKAASLTQVSNYTVEQQVTTNSNTPTDSPDAIVPTVVIATALVIGALVSVACLCHSTSYEQVQKDGMTEEDFKMNQLN
jgi:DMSO reductase anchor subunit